MNRDEFVSRLFARAKEAGFEDCEVYCASGSEFSCSVFQGEIVSYSSADSSGLGFRGIIGGKMGYASTQAMDEEAIDMLVEGAKTNAELIESEDEEFIFPGSEEYAQVDTFNPALEEIPTANKLEMCRQLEKLAMQKSDKVAQAESEVMSGSDEVAIINTKGLNVSGKGNYWGAYVGPLVKDGDKVNTGFKFKISQDEAGLDIDVLADEAVREAVDGLYAQSTASGEMPVCVRGDAMAELNSDWSAFANSLS